MVLALTLCSWEQRKVHFAWQSVLMECEAGCPHPWKGQGQALPAPPKPVPSCVTGLDCLPISGFSVHYSRCWGQYEPGPACPEFSRPCRAARTCPPGQGQGLGVFVPQERWPPGMWGVCSLPPQFSHVSQRTHTFWKLTDSSLADTPAFHAAPSLDALPTKRARATGTIKFI